MTATTESGTRCWKLLTDGHARLKMLDLITIERTHDELTGQMCRIFKEISEAMPVGRTLYIDFAEVLTPVDSLLIAKVIQKLEEMTADTGKGLFRDRYIVVENPNDSAFHLFDLLLRDRNASLVVIRDSDPKPVILGALPPFLEETYKLLEDHGRLTSGEVCKRLGKKKSTSGRERLHQLYRRGLVTRTPAVDAETGRPSFAYETFKPMRQFE